MNEDSSSISFKEFNLSPQDTYPSFTLCFQGDKGDTIYNASKNESLQYWKTITGKINATEKVIDNMPDFSSITIKLRNMIKEFYTVDESNHKINKWELEKKHSTLDMCRE